MQRFLAARHANLFLIICSTLWIAYLAVPHLHGRSSFVEPIESWLLDLRYQLVGTQTAAPEIVFVAIDDTTLEDGQGGPVGRARLARLINHIADSGAKTLVVDILLADAGPISERVSLSAALTRVPTIIAAAARLDERGVATVIWPHTAFRAQAEVGLVNISVGPSGIPRYIPLIIEAEGELLPSIPLLAALSLTSSSARITDRNLWLGDRAIPIDAAANMPLRLLGPAGTVPTISANRIMDTNLVEALSGKLVVLGYSAAAMGDRFVTPFDDDLPGAEIIATAISQLISGETLRRDNQIRIWDVAHAATLTAICLALVLLLPLLQAIPVIFMLLTLSFALLTWLFAEGLWLSAALPLAAALPPVATAGASSLIRERQKANRSDRSLASLRRFQSPALARRIENDSDYLMTPLAQDIVILFVDLTGFTALSQRLGPEGTGKLLQDFHRLTANAVEDRNGIIINFMGDGALAVFGLEKRDEKTDADKALLAAEELEKSLGKIHLPPGLSALTCRIGLHHGTVILSRLGGDNHQQVSVSGDNVNLASRLLELAKVESARIVATREFVDRLSARASLSETREANIMVRGRSGNVGVVIWPTNQCIVDYEK